MKRIKTYVGLAGMMAFALTVHAEQTTPPADPALSNPNPVSEQEYHVLDSQDNTSVTNAEALNEADNQAEVAKYEALYAALREERSEAPEGTNAVAEETTEVPADTETELVLAQATEESATSEDTAGATNVVGEATGAEEMSGDEATETEVVEEVEDVEVPPSGTLVDTEEATVVIPLIVMDEVPLMDAIRNLARQANINYMVDPKVPYGQMGEDGTVTPQPILSIRWENVTAEQALIAVLNNYDLQMTMDPKAKIYSVTVKDPAAPDPLVTKIIQLKYASPTNVVTAVQSTFTDKRSKVVADIRTSQIVVVATEQELVSVEDMIEQLDKPTRQVLIEGRIIETTANPRTIKGIDWSGTLNEHRFTFGNGSTFQSGLEPTPPQYDYDPVTGQQVQTDPGYPGMLSGVLGSPGFLVNTMDGFNPDTFFLNAEAFSATLSFLNTHADSKEIATPRAVTLDNEPARLAVTRAFPIFKNTAGTQGSPGGSEVTYTNLGIILDVTPRISANDTINLKVIPEVSSIFDTVEKVVASTVNQADIYDIRRIETRVLIPSGNTLVMGGLLRDRTRNGNIKVPILGDIPVLGLLFRQDTKERDKINLMVFITPTIVQDADFQPTPTDFLKSKFEEPTDEEWGAWDSGKPWDWSRRKK